LGPDNNPGDYQVLYGDFAETYLLQEFDVSFTLTTTNPNIIEDPHVFFVQYSLIDD
jgi:hypothetical protein